MIIGSADCSVSLNDINGNQIGIFGQTEHWKLDPYAQAVALTSTKGTTARKMSNSVIAQEIEKETNNDDSNSGGFITELNNDSTENLNQDSSLNNFVFKREYTGLAPHITFQFE